MTETTAEQVALEIPATTQQKQIAEEISSLAARIITVRQPQELQMIVGEIRSRVEALALTLPAPNGTCSADGAPLFRANGPDGAFDVCAYGHRWPAGR